jgi:hypothetical protein
MVIFVVTTCIGSAIRDAQYEHCISRLLKIKPEGAPVIIVEGNGARPTSLDQFADRARVIYTNNNKLGLKNKGHTELLDIIEALTLCGVPCDEFVVKMTGRYFVEEPALFFQTCVSARADACVKFGSFITPSDDPISDCVTGLIGMRASLIRKIHTPRDGECVEWLWARAALSADSFIAWKGQMGLSLCPGSDTYFSI